jgi:hypothetical protein
VAKGENKESLEPSTGNTPLKKHRYRMLIIEKINCRTCSSHRWYYFIKSSYAALLDSVPKAKEDANAVHHPLTILNCSSIIHPINPTVHSLIHDQNVVGHLLSKLNLLCSRFLDIFPLIVRTSPLPILLSRTTLSTANFRLTPRIRSPQQPSIIRFNPTQCLL